MVASRTNAQNIAANERRTAKRCRTAPGSDQLKSAIFYPAFPRRRRLTRLSGLPARKRYSTRSPGQALAATGEMTAAALEVVSRRRRLTRLVRATRSRRAVAPVSTSVTGDDTFIEFINSCLSILRFLILIVISIIFFSAK